MYLVARPTIATRTRSAPLSPSRFRIRVFASIRQHKGSLYARAGIDDYWIVNLVDRVLEIHREPAPDPSALYGWRYRSVTTLTPPAFVVPLAFASARIAVTDLLL